MAGKRGPSIGSMRHRLKITAWAEVPTGETGVVRHREPIAEVWGSIEPMKAYDVYGWQTSVGKDDAPTHKITIRNPNDISLTSQHWFYTVTKRERAWFKILTIMPMGIDSQFLEATCSRRTFRDVRADPTWQDTPAANPLEQENQMQEPAMDAPTVELPKPQRAAPSGLDRFRR